MRIPSGSTDRYIYFVAVDSADLKTRETGLSSFTVYRGRNGAAPAAMTTPTINETDSTNMPGVYELLLDEDTTLAAGNDTEEMVFHVTASGMAPVTRVVEIYRPKATEGRTLGIESDGDLTKVNTLDGHTAQTGDSYARLGAPAGASVSADIATIDGNVDAILVDTGTTIPALLPTSLSGGRMRCTVEAFVATAIAESNAGDIADSFSFFFNVNPTTTKTVDDVGVAGSGLTQQNVRDAMKLAPSAGAASAGSVDEHLDEILADVTGINGDAMRGTDSAYTGTPPTVAQIRTEMDSNSTQLAAIVADTNELQGDWANGGRLDLILDARASQASVDTIDGNVDAILVDTGTTIPAQITALNDISTADVNAQVLDVLNTDTLVAGQTIAEALRRIGAVACYKISGAGTGTETITDWADSASTIVVTVDASGNRSAITFN